METYLPKCLSSHIVDDKGLMELLEVLVINDGSTDRSSEIAHSYEKQYPGTFRVIDKENGNYGSCINAALKVATGKYIKTLDADDYFDTTAFKGLLQMLCNTDVDLVLHYALTVFPDGKEGCEYGLSEEFREVVNKGKVSFCLDDLIKNGVHPMMHNITYRTEILRRIEYRQLEGISYTDNQWTFLPMAHVKTIQLYPHVVYMYLMGRDGQTVSPANLHKFFDDEVKMTSQLCRDYASFQGDEIGKRYLHSALKGHLVGAYKGGIEYDRYLEKDIRRLDVAIRTIIPELYKELDSLRLNIVAYRHSVSLKWWRKDNGCWFYATEAVIRFFWDPYKKIKRGLS